MKMLPQLLVLTWISARTIYIKADAGTFSRTDMETSIRLYKTEQ